MKRAVSSLGACALFVLASLSFAQHADAQSAESDSIWEAGVGLFEKTCFPDIDTVAVLEQQALSAGFTSAEPDVHSRIKSTYEFMIEPRAINFGSKQGIRTYPELVVMQTEVFGLTFFAMLSLEARDDAPYQVSCNIWHYTKLELSEAGDAWNEFNKKALMSKRGYAGGGNGRSNGSITENYLHLSTQGDFKS